MLPALRCSGGGKYVFDAIGKPSGGPHDVSGRLTRLEAFAFFIRVMSFAKRIGGLATLY
jgi:hypothetical protein